MFKNANMLGKSPEILDCNGELSTGKPVHLSPPSGRFMHLAKDDLYKNIFSQKNKILKKNLDCRAAQRQSETTRFHRW